MTNVDQVSIENDTTLEVSGISSNTRDAILSALATGAMTTRYLATVTGISLLTVRPNVTKLFKAGKLVKAGKTKHMGISENLFALLIH